MGSKKINNNNQPGNFLIYLLFLIITFLYSIKQESQAFAVHDYSSHSEETYSGVIVDPDNTKITKQQWLSFFDSAIQVNFANLALNSEIAYLSLKFSLLDSQHYSLVPSGIFLPATHILDILQNTNIWHQSSEDPPLPTSL